MAVAMAPFPEEVDVFTAPHWRMKQLVGLYCDKVKEWEPLARAARAERGAGQVPGRPGLRRACSPPRPCRANCRLRSCQRRAGPAAPSPGFGALGTRDAALSPPPTPPPGHPPPSGPPPVPAASGRGAPSLPTGCRGPAWAICGGFPAPWGRPFLPLPPAPPSPSSLPPPVPRPVWGSSRLSANTPSILPNF